MLGIYFDEYNELSDVKRNEMKHKYNPKKLFLKKYNSYYWSDKKELVDKEESVDLSDIPPLAGDKEEVKEGKGLKMFTPEKLLTRLPISLAQIKAGNNSYRLKK